MTKPMDAATARRAEAHLARVDPVMRGLIERHGPCRLPRAAAPPFDTLVGSIISQQLSTKAAATIKARVVALAGGAFDPAALLDIPAERLREAGLSGAKARYVRALAERAASGELGFEELASRDDAEVTAALVTVPGIGRWTAEMFLIFGLGRPDVLALGDGGLQRAATLLYPKTRRKMTTLEAVAEPWRPYRSVASWYLWRSLDNEPA